MNRLENNTRNIRAESMASPPKEAAAADVMNKKRKNQYSVAVYLAVMFAMVMILMVLSYFIGQRNNAMISELSPGVYDAGLEALETEGKFE